MNKRIISNSSQETQKIAEEFASEIKPATIICLNGGLGAGKTIFTKGLAKGLGVQVRVISPTYSIVHQYDIEDSIEGRPKTLYHLDLYRLENEAEIKNIGIDEILSDQEGVVVIEWAEKMNDMLPNERYDIRLSEIDGESRQIDFCALHNS